ncbi:MAG: hypothetical protein JW738_01500 [Actinobacteria bacterium]|nr:hypothetical protein [Actinomycetota bacterium]
MEKCPKHPDRDTMVPCLGCGRYFCRVCTPPRGAGQLCRNCYEESVSKLALKTGEKSSDGKAGGQGPKEERAGHEKRKKHEFRSFFTVFGRKLKSMPGGTARFIKGHFPMGMAGKEKTGGTMPPLLQSWYKLLIIVIGATLIWVLAVALIKRRIPLISILTAAIIAVGVVVAFNGRMDLETAVIASSLTFLVLGMGEVAVYVLYRAEMIESLDIMGATLKQIEQPVRYFTAYFYNMLAMRIVPSCIVAFTIALWPFSKRFSWRGFKTGAAS